MNELDLAILDASLAQLWHEIRAGLQNVIYTSELTTDRQKWDAAHDGLRESLRALDECQAKGHLLKLRQLRRTFVFYPQPLKNLEAG